ncbi:MAG: hypothetical protein ACOC0R_03910, partial [Mariniphaga sp.]
MKQSVYKGIKNFLKPYVRTLPIGTDCFTPACFMQKTGLLIQTFADLSPLLLFEWRVFALTALMGARGMKGSSVCANYLVLCMPFIPLPLFPLFVV